MHPTVIATDIENTIPAEAARRYYDFWGRRYDWFSFFEGHARSRLLELLDLSPEVRLLNVGLGTGQEHRQIIARLGRADNAIGVDISWAMLQSAQARSGAPLCQADGMRLPFAGSAFDRLYAAYLLDLVSLPCLPGWLREFRRVIRPGGRIVLACLTEGNTPASRSLVSLWKLAYRISPLACGGCRPLQLDALVDGAGFHILRSEVIVQLGVPSQVICATN